MPRSFPGSGLLPFLVLCSAMSGAPALGQQQPSSRVTQPIDDRIRVTLAGNVHPLAQPRFDQGIVPDSFPAERMLLIVRRNPEREAALRAFLEQAHTPGSASYHRWLTPEQFGESYGPPQVEIAAVAGWLGKQGFSVARVTKSRTAIEFSGNAGQLRRAFHTEIHTYLVNGKEHHANNRDPEIPAALAPVVAGITPLNDFRPQPQVRVLGQVLYGPRTDEAKPLWTLNSTPPLLALAPGDFAVQYDLGPLYSAGVNGAGVTIGIIGASNVDPDVVADYRSFFGLAPNALNVVIDGLDPGPSATIPQGNWATLESYLDVEIAGGVAPGATINLYTAADTSVQSGLLLAAQRAVDDDQASVLSTSYSACEYELGRAGNQFFAALWEQAAAQGQTSFVAAGDSGAAGCDDFQSEETAQQGLAVNGLASTPWNVAVGGTDFFYSSYAGSSAAQNAQVAAYWNLSGASVEMPATSLVEPLPEQPWNHAFGLNLSDNGIYKSSAPSIVAGSGGASNCVPSTGAPAGSGSGCTGGYPKPAWQSGKGVPADGVRDLPDVSLFAAAGENESFYPICLPGEGCTGLSPASAEVTAVGGTSASSPAMAAILSLVVQQYGRQGQANFVFYPLAAQHPSAFRDVTIGSNVVPCMQGTPDCALSTVNDNTSGFYTLGRYYAGPGYDQSSGLGSVDANLLVQYWNSLNFTASSTSLNLNQTTFTHGTPVNVSVAVTGGGGTPTGDVGFVATESAALANISLNELALKNGTATAAVNDFPGGQYQLTARYTGDTVFAASNSSPVTLNVSPEPSTITLSGNYWGPGANSFLPISSGATYPYGSYIVMDAQPVGINAPAGGTDGIATGTVTFTDAAGLGPASSGPVNLNVKGIAEWQPSGGFPVGGNSVSASYSGDASFNASTSSAPLVFTIAPAQTYAQLNASPASIAVGSPTTLSLLISVPYLGPPCEDGSCTFHFPTFTPPTGTATFTLGTTMLGTAPLIANQGASGYAWATLQVATLPLGKQAITASYSGDANYIPATASATVTVQNLATLSAAANPNTIDQAEYTAITAMLTGPTGSPVPTGTVTFAAPAGTANVWTSNSMLGNGSATSAPLPGQDFLGNVLVSVSYSGDANYGPASINVPLTVTQGSAAPFTLSATAVTISTPGATTGNTSTITATPGAGFQGTIYLSCALASYPTGAENLPSCGFPTPTLNLSGAKAASATMLISSTPANSAETPYFRSSGRNWLAAEIAAAGFALLLVLVFRRRGEWRLAAGCALLLAVFAGLAACGGNGGASIGGGGGATANPGTTPGTYGFTVNAAFSAGGVSQVQTTVTATIQ